MFEAITSFSGRYRWLSNFWPAPVLLFGSELYPTVEHAFQAAKTLDRAERDAIRTAPTPGTAKYLGRRCTLRADWESVKLSAMRHLLMQKFAHPELHALLMSTGDAMLVEGNTWGDRFWGVCKGVGENHLGLMLMEIRASRRSGAQL